MEGPLRLLYLPNERYPNNRVRLTELFMKEFTGRGNEVFWIFLSEEVESTTARREGGNHLTLIPATRRGGSLKLFLDRFRKLRKYRIARRLVTDGKIDIVLANDGLIDGLIAYRLSRKYGVPFVFYLSSIFHEIDRWEFRHKKDVKTFYKFLESYLKEPVYRFLIRKADIFHPITLHMQKHLKRKVDRPMHPLPICPARVFLSRQKGDGGPGDPVRIIVVGSMGRTRKVDLFIEAMDRLMKIRPERRTELRLIGKVTDPGYLSFLRKKIEHRGLKESVIISGEVPLEEVPDLLIASDIGLSVYPPILPWKLGSPSKLVEYMAVGLPFIADGGILDQRELVERSGAGMIVDFDPEELANALDRMVRDYPAYLERSRRAREWIRNNRTYGRMAADIDSLYREMVKGGGTG